MKNVFLILVLLTGFAVSGLQAQNCPPCPPCPACPQGCCIGAAKKSSSASAQVVPATLDLTAACNPEMMAACHGDKKMTKKEMKACQAACTSNATPACQPAAAKSSPTAGETIDQQYYQAPTPQKG